MAEETRKIQQAKLEATAKLKGYIQAAAPRVSLSEKITSL